MGQPASLHLILYGGEHAACGARCVIYATQGNDALLVRGVMMIFRPRFYWGALGLGPMELSLWGGRMIHEVRRLYGLSVYTWFFGVMRTGKVVVRDTDGPTRFDD